MNLIFSLNTKKYETFCDRVNIKPLIDYFQWIKLILYSFKLLIIDSSTVDMSALKRSTPKLARA